MQCRNNLTHLVLAIAVVLGLAPLMVAVDVEAQIAFVSDRDGNPEIYVMDADGGNQHRLTGDPNDDWSPSWSPDGKQIVFMSARDGHVDAIHGFPFFEIYVMDADGGNPRNLTNNPSDDRDPSWSPDGERIAFVSDRDGDFEIYVMDTDGDNQHRLTANPNEDEYPSWSPDGERIAFVSVREGHFNYEIYVMDADGGNTQRLTENLKNEWDPSWSPDGEWIAFAFDGKGDFENFEIYVMDADGGNQRRLTENRDDDVEPSWSPGGERIVFMSERDGNGEIYVSDADGRNQRNLTNHRGWDGSPSWLNSPFSVSPAGKRFTVWGWLKQIDQ